VIVTEVVYSRDLKICKGGSREWRAEVVNPTLRFLFHGHGRRWRIVSPSTPSYHWNPRQDMKNKRREDQVPNSILWLKEGKQVERTEFVHPLFLSTLPLQRRWSIPVPIFLIKYLCCISLGVVLQLLDVLLNVVEHPCSSSKKKSVRYTVGHNDLTVFLSAINVPTKVPLRNARTRRQDRARFFSGHGNCRRKRRNF